VIEKAFVERIDKSRRGKQPGLIVRSVVGLMFVLSFHGSLGDSIIRFVVIKFSKSELEKENVLFDVIASFISVGILSYSDSSILSSNRAAGFP
jgi:hypothetical protein